MESESIEAAHSIIKKLETRRGLIELTLAGADEDYNPAAPNDYEKMLVKRNKLKKEMEARIHNDKVLKEHIEATKKSQLQGPTHLDEMEMSAEEAY